MDHKYYNKMYKSSLAISIILLTTSSNTFAWTTYNQYNSPSYLLQQGSVYKYNNPYDNNNPNNPYSPHQSAYNPNSFRNNYNQYSEPVYTYYGQFQGNITQQLYYSQSITNPYGQHGSVYDTWHPSNPYLPQKWNNPNSLFQSPYTDIGARNNVQYGVQYQDGYGTTIGATSTQVYNSQSITNPYNNSPFDEHNVTNPYGKNKVFK